MKETPTKMEPSSPDQSPSISPEKTGGAYRSQRNVNDVETEGSFMKSRDLARDNKNDTKYSSSNTHQAKNKETPKHGLPGGAMDAEPELNGSNGGLCGRERLKRHRTEVAGRVWIPEIWGQEALLKDWIDCSVFDASLVPNNITSARSALVEEDRRANSGRLRVENRC
uniref:Protein BIC1 n=1 Tax=Rhizophora mucronata TaxID=61149 RepID=A0A2P2Q622_RHIMU